MHGLRRFHGRRILVACSLDSNLVVGGHVTCRSRKFRVGGGREFPHP